MKRSELEVHTRPNLMAALKAAGCTGLSRAKKSELIAAALELRGKARASFLASLPERNQEAHPKAPQPTRRALAKPAGKTRRKLPVAAERDLPPKREAVAEPVTTTLGKAKALKFDVDRNGQTRRAPEPGDFPLPDSYGMDLFHVLVFDPNSAYVFWELSPSSLAPLAEKHGSAWDDRKLCVRASTPDGRLVQKELYGDRGSYYLELGFPGERVNLSLGFLLAGSFVQVLPARSVTFPRDRESEDTATRLMSLKPSQELKESEPVTPEEAFGHEVTGLGEEHRRWSPLDASSSGSSTKKGEGR